jgi:hypothetical protein
VSGTGVILVSGEVFRWRPWVREMSTEDVGGKQRRTLLNKKGQWDVDESAWGVLDLVWPKPGKLYAYMEFMDLDVVVVLRGEYANCNANNRIQIF